MNVFNTTTEKILSAFTGTIKKLESHIDSMDSDIDTFNSVIQVAKVKRDNALKEKAHAQKAVNQLKAFVDGPTS